MKRTGLSRTPWLRQGTGLKRGSGPARVTPLKPGKPFGRKVPLGRNPEPKAGSAPKARSPQGSVRAALRLVLACEMTVAEASRVHGCDRDALEAAARRACRGPVMDRDHWTCASCGRMAQDVQHRVRRGSGGTSDPRIAFGMPNQLGMCRLCHRLAEARDPVMRERGFWLYTWEDPASVPVDYAGEGRFFLLADGSREAVPADWAGAA